MSKVKRNDPCPCGSGKKYKHCHEPIDRAHDDHLRLLRRAMDRLFSTLIEATQAEELLPYVGPNLQTYWEGAYSLDQMSELDELEDRGSERFLTWLAFDAPTADDQSTLVERIAASPPADLELDEHELELLPTWTSTRLRPYIVSEVIKGKGARVRDLLSDAEYSLRDHAAAKRLEDGELLIAHLVPVGDDYFIAGAAAQATADTVEKLQEFIAIEQESWSLEHPDAAEAPFDHARSARLNHFVMALPREEHPSRLDDLLLKGRVGLSMARSALGKHTPGDDEDDLDSDADTDDAEDWDDDDDWDDDADADDDWDDDADDADDDDWDDDADDLPASASAPTVASPATQPEAEDPEHAP